jgi:hypothetical protein
MLIPLTIYYSLLLLLLALVVVLHEKALTCDRLNKDFFLDWVLQFI